MSQSPFSSRLSLLLQRARQAVRMYSGVGRSSGHAEPGNGEREAQAREWRVTNELLLSRLAALVGVRPITAVTPREVGAVLHQFEREGVEEGKLLSEGSIDLVSLAQAGDYVSAARTARELVTLQARCQAIAAVVHELGVLLQPHGIRGSDALGEEGVVRSSAHRGGAGDGEGARSVARGEHHFIAQRVRATMEGRGRVDSPDDGHPTERGAEEHGLLEDRSDDAARQRIRKVVPLRAAVDGLK